MASFREHSGVEVDSWIILRMVALCAQEMGHGDMDVLQVVTRLEPLKDLIKEDKCQEPLLKNTT